MQDIIIYTKEKIPEMPNGSDVNILYEHRLVEVKKDNKMIIIPFEIIIYIEMVKKV